ncbi:arylamine N-acetyltransferase [Microtetraspora sp. AC03309]|uniref:arylamine N-acetyltransferase family protein n=1 Tax=Microtetraspora sp. AC03309 TaxID=2779376 RepID=UPI001E4AE7DE|nr:arylamine N-acetyltransferase [Microtetraspora sp. AC03309]MCC5574725.1 arylamine N-acetyltransferase [Microtetraspora sp. AC03309]
MIDRYLRRLGLSEGPPSVEALFRLQSAHVERVAYENLEIWLDRPTTVDPAESVRRIASGRGGYCFHLNGAFSVLLKELGYQVTRHFGGVQNSPDNPPGADGNHLVLMVSGLPSDGNPDGRWFVDAGLGDAIHEPLPLMEGAYAQGPFRYGLRRSEAEPGGWRFDHDPRGGFAGMDFRPEPTGMDAFAAKHEYLSTSPESGFVQVAAIQRRDVTGLDKLTGLVLKRIGAGPESSTTLDRPEDYFGALADVFGLTLDDVTAPEREKLWQRLYGAHERWMGRNDLS